MPAVSLGADDDLGRHGGAMTQTAAGILAQLRSGDWLDARRIRAYAIILLTLQIAFFAFMIAGTHGWIVPLDHATTTDFVSFYAAGSLADAGTPALAYDHAAHLAAEEAIAGAGIEYQYFNYPPVYQALFALVAHLPYLVAFVLFEAATLVFYLGVARRVLGDDGVPALLALAAFPIVFWNFGLGQNAFLTAALFGAGTLLVDRRPILAGLCFGALCYKPHFALLVPVALAAGGRWSSFAAAAAAAAFLVLLSFGLLGWDTWRAFFVTAGASHSMYESGRILFSGFVSPFGAVRLLHGGVTLGYAVQGIFTITAATVVAIVWRRGLSLPVRAAVLAAATLVAVPVAVIYDLMLATVAACWLVRDKESVTGWEKSVLAVLYAMLFGWRYLAEAWLLPVGPLAVLALFAIAANRAWREIGQHRPIGELDAALPAGE
jgi:alpha-1,2-mannosyltransferase